MFLEIIIPFLSTISLLLSENLDFCSLKVKISFLFKDVCIILNEKIKIKEKKIKNNK